MRNRILSAIMTLILVISLCPVTARAATEKTWAGVLPAFLTGANALSGYGTEADPYRISTPMQLAYCIERYNNSYTPKYMVLTADINLSAYLWRNTDKFNAVLDGQGHTISGLRLWDDHDPTMPNNESSSLLGSIGTKGVVRNVTIASPTFYDGGIIIDVGALAQANQGTVENCSLVGRFSVDLSSSEESGTRVGGLVGSNGGTMTECRNYGTVKVVNSSAIVIVGGVAGTNSGTMEYCASHGPVTAETAAEALSVIGGVAGELHPTSAGAIMRACANSGAVTGGNMSRAGGIVGSVYSNSGSYTAAVNDCHNSGAVTGHQYVGGVAGFVQGGTVRFYQCGSSGTVFAAESGSAGGILGEMYTYGSAAVNIEACVHSGTVSSETGQAGGIAGVGGTAAINECRNEGSVEAPGSWAGGIVGSTAGSITACVNLGDVTGDAPGGLAGNLETDGVITGCANAGAVTGSDYWAAGLVRSNNGHIERSYHAGTVAGERVAGLAAYQDGTISRCFVNGAVSAVGDSAYAYGLAIINSGTIDNCFVTGSLTAFSAVDGQAWPLAVDSGTLENVYAAGSVAAETVCMDGGATCYYLDTLPVTKQWGEAAACTDAYMRSEAFVAQLNENAGSAVWQAGDPYPALADVAAGYTAPAVTGSAFDDYYGTLQSRSFRVSLQGVGYQSEGPVVSAHRSDDGSEAWYPRWQGNAASMTVMIPDGYTGGITFSCPGYTDYTLPAELMGTYNRLKLWKTSDKPIPQNAFLAPSGQAALSYTNLLVSSALICEGDSQLYDLYIAPGWGSGGSGTASLVQGEVSIPLAQGWNRGLPLGSQFTESGGSVYLRLENETHTVRCKLGLEVTAKASATLDFNLGKSHSISTEGGTVNDCGNDIQGSDFSIANLLGGGTKQLSMDFSSLTQGVVPINASLAEDGTVEGTIGLTAWKGKHTGAQYGMLAEALDAYDKYSDTEDLTKAIEELNKDGLVRENAASVAVAGSIQLLGIFEGKLTHTGLDFVKFQCVIQFSGSAGYTQQFTVLGLPAYAETGIKAAIQSAFMEWSQSTKGLEPLLDHEKPLSFSIEVYFGAGPGIPKVLSVGVRSSLGLKMTTIFPYDPQIASWHLEGNGYLTASALGLGNEWRVLGPYQLYIYKNGVWFPDETAATALSLLEGSGMTQPDRAYLETGTVYHEGLSLLAVEDAMTTVTPFADNTYYYTAPQCVTFDDGSSLYVWVADAGTTERPVAENRTALYYRFRSADGTWGNAARVEMNSDTADFAPVLAASGSSAWLLWQDAGQVYAEGATLSDLSRGLGLSAASFDAKSGTFSTPVSLHTTQSGTDLMAALIPTESGVRAIWAHNSAGDITCQTGTTSIMTAAMVIDPYGSTEPTWSEPVTLLADAGTVTALTGADMGGAAAVWYTRDMDGILAPAADGTCDTELFALIDGTATRLSVDTVNDEDPIYTGGQLIWRQDGRLVAAPAADPAAAVTVSDQITGQYLYCPGTQGIDALVFTESGETTSRLAALFNDGTGWGSPVTLSAEQPYIFAMGGGFAPDGTLRLLSNQRGVKEDGSLGAAALTLYETTPCCDLTMEGADYDAFTLTGSELTVTAELSNSGTTAISGVQLTVTAGEIAQTFTVPVTLLSGERERITQAVTLPEGFTDSTLAVTALPLGRADSREEDNTAVCTLRWADLSAEALTARSAEGKTFFTAQIANRGRTDLTDLTVELRQDTPDGKLLAVETVDTLAARTPCLVDFTLNTALPEGSVVYAVVSGTAEENLTANNRVLTTVFSGEEEAVSVTASALKNGTTVTVTAEVVNDGGVPVYLVAAAYDSSGRQLSAVRRDAAEGANTLVLENAGSGAVRLYVLDEAGIPLLPALDLTVR